MNLSIIRPSLVSAFSIMLSIILMACATTSQKQIRDDSDVIFNTLVAEFALQENDKEKSAEYYAKALEKSTDVDFITAVIEFSLSNGNYINAIRAAEILFELKPEDETLKRLLPYLYLSTAQPARAISMLDLLADPALIEAIFTKISAVGLLQLDEEKLAGLQQAAEHFADNVSAQYAYAISANYLQLYEKAIIFSDHGLRLAPMSEIGYQIKADALQHLGRDDESATVLRLGLDRDPGNNALRMNYAETLYKLQRNQDAYNQFLRLYQVMPEVSARVLQLLGSVALELDRNEEALEYFQELEDFSGFNLRANYLQAYALYRQNAFSKALALLQNIPSNAGTLFEQAQLLAARIYQDQMMIDEAIAQLRWALEQTKDSDQRINFYIAQGRILSVAEQYTEAHEVYSEAIEDFPGDLTLYLLRAYNGIKMNNISRIEQDVRYILSQDENHVDALNLLGYHLADMNIRLTEARQYLLRAYELSPEDPRIIDSMGWIEFRLQNFAAAENLIRQAIEKHPDPEIYGHLVEILRARNKIQEANKALNEALQTYPDDKYLNSL